MNTDIWQFGLFPSDGDSFADATNRPNRMLISMLRRSLVFKLLPHWLSIHSEL